MKFLSVLALAAAVSAAAVAPRDGGEWNGWGCSTVTVYSTEYKTEYKTEYMTKTETEYKTNTVTATVTAPCEKGEWNGWSG